MAITVNGQDISTFGAKLIDYTVGGIPYTDNFVKPPKHAFPIGFAGTDGLREITLSMDFVSTSAAAAEANVSNFVAECMSGCELLLPDGFYYTCVFGSAEASKHVAPWINQIAVKMKGVRHGEKVTSSTISAAGTLVVSGNRPTPAKVTVSGVTDGASITINGTEIEFTDITGIVIIDGINCTVTSSGINVFANTNLTAFPVLNAGNNSIDMTSGVSVTFEYYPLYV